jgi:hypothetical protein
VLFVFLVSQWRKEKESKKIFKTYAGFVHKMAEYALLWLMSLFVNIKQK